MEIKKETITTVLSTDNKPINKGDMCILVTNDDKPYWGKFVGITNKGALEFDTPYCDLRVMPKNVKLIYHANVVIPAERV